VSASTLSPSALLPSTLTGRNTMTPNVGGIDRALRVAAGLALIALTLAGVIGVWGWIGIVPLATAALGFCPLYTVLGFSSCPIKSK
jgi:hypothetical protein